MRIRVGGVLGGIIMIVIFAFILTGALTWILSFISDHFIKKETAKKVISRINGALFGITVILIILDIAGVLPLYQYILNWIFDLLNSV